EETSAACSVACEHKAFGIECDARSGKPVGVRIRADEEKEVADLPPRLLPGDAIPRAHRLQHAISTFKRADFGTRYDLDIGPPLDPLHQIARHRGAKVRAAHQHRNFGDLAGEINYRLTSRVARTNQRDLLTGAQVQLQRRSPIMHARSLERFEVGDGEAAI